MSACEEEEEEEVLCVSERVEDTRGRGDRGRFTLERAPASCCLGGSPRIDVAIKRG